jgi:hypothetical protein
MEIRLTVLHELGHYFGVTEAQLEDVYRRVLSWEVLLSDQSGNGTRLLKMVADRRKGLCRGAPQ